jgi:serine/threonine protein kinase
MMRLCGGGQDLISGLLTLDPAHRLTAKQALQHPWVRKPHVRPATFICQTLLTC